ncbi:hypothetical protein LCGC14_3123970, partial [marine sediment metagenome]
MSERWGPMEEVELIEYLEASPKLQY